jgi:hypothetical protein
VDTFSSASSTSVGVTADWMRALRPGNAVELTAYGERMSGRIQQISADSITVRIPVEEQLPDVRRYTVHGTATISLETGAARVPVSARSVGDIVRMQFTGPAEVIQRRQHVRVTVSLPVSLRWMAADGDPDRADSHTIDLSVGGLRVAAVRTVWPSAGSLALVSLALPTGTLEHSALVIGLTPTYDLRLAFVSPYPMSVEHVLSLAR